MPDITPDMPRRDMTCKGVILSAPLPYVEGHALEDNEASVMNQVWIENLRNNFGASVIEKYTELGAWDEDTDKPIRALTPEEVLQLQGEFDDYTKGYSFGVRTGGRAPVDPVMAQALQMAEVSIRKAIKSKGMTVASVGREKLRSLCEEAIGKNPKFLEKAREIVAARQEAAEELTVDL